MREKFKSDRQSAWPYSYCVCLFEVTKKEYFSTYTKDTGNMCLGLVYRKWEHYIEH